MKIVVDAFGGDNAPLAVLQGCALAQKEYSDITIVLVGDEAKMRSCAEKNGVDLAGMQICQADDIIQVEDDPLEIRRSKAGSSMGIGMTLLKTGEGDAFVSAGSTGALAVGSSTIVGRIKGIRRAALSPIMPSATGKFMLVDAGANIECRPEMLLQFAVMGSAYMELVEGVKSPRVGLANVGAEPTKGTETLRQAYQLLQGSSRIHFVGNVEARDVPLGACDVVVADGLSGNMILKTMEGTCKFFISTLKQMFMASAGTKVAALLMKGQLAGLKQRMDYTEYGGAVLMGVAKPVIKAHGSSNANAFKNAVRQARKCVLEGVVSEIAESMRKITEAQKGQ